MKKQALILSAAFIAGSVMFISCGGEEKKSAPAPVQTVKAEYKCPMKCSEQAFDKPGKCPECGMVLEKVTNS